VIIIITYVVALGEFAPGDGIDRPDPLAVRGQPLEPRRLRFGIAPFRRVEPERFGQPRRKAFEAVDRLRGKVRAPRLLGLGARRGSGPPFASLRRLLVGRGDGRSRIYQRPLSLGLRRARLADARLLV
jgi:hypothetical protein